MSQSILDDSVGRRVALLIGTARYGDDFEDLRGPPNDVVRLGEVLSNPRIGSFGEVHPLLDQSRATLAPFVERTLRTTSPEDLLLIYFSGHGKLDARGQLCLTLTDTTEDALLSTSFPVSLLREMMGECRAERIVVWLDCCYSGAIGPAFVRSSVGDQIQLLKARGTYIMSSATGTETALERESDDDGIVLGDFTRALVGGLATGGADRRNRGYVTVDDLRVHVEGELRGQSPRYWGLENSGTLVLARNPTFGAVPDQPSRALLSPDLDLGDLEEVRKALERKSIEVRRAYRASGAARRLARTRARLWAARAAMAAATTLAAIGPSCIILTAIWIPSRSWGSFETAARISAGLLGIPFARIAVLWVLDRLERWVSGRRDDVMEALGEARLSPVGADSRLADLLVRVVRAAESGSVTEATDQLILEAREILAQAKRAVTGRIATERKARSALESERRQVSDWKHRTMLAVKEGRDDLGERALVHMQEHQRQAAILEDRWQRITDDSEKAKARLRELDGRVKMLVSLRAHLVSGDREANVLASTPNPDPGQIPAIENILRLASSLFVWSPDTAALDEKKDYAADYEIFKASLRLTARDEDG